MISMRYSDPSCAEAWTNSRGQRSKVSTCRRSSALQEVRKRSLSLAFQRQGGARWGTTAKKASFDGIFGPGESKTMENAWQLFLRQLASPDLFTYDDVCGWSADEFEALTGAGLISEMAQATHVTCACPEGHWERVRWSADGKLAFIPCTVAGTLVEVSLERLRQWRVDVGHLAVLLADALQMYQQPQPLAS